MEKEIADNFKTGYVAIVGQPNVGKSTLLNNFLNLKVSAVTARPQTTRHQIRGILTAEDHQVIFLDTPGLLQPKYKLQDAMLKAAYRAVSEADVVLFMVKAASQPDDADVSFLDKLARRGPVWFLVINKIDLIHRNDVLPLIDFYRRYEWLKSIVPISALKLDGLDVLRREIVQALPVGLPLYDKDQVLDHPERFMVAELIREKIFQKYGEEIPYSVSVSIEEFKERPNQKDFIRAIIFVERDSQKGILIGKKGSTLKSIGRLAREEIEFLLDRDVYLELWVKVREKWRQDEKTLKEFGYYN